MSVIGYSPVNKEFRVEESYCVCFNSRLNAVPHGLYIASNPRKDRLLRSDLLQLLRAVDKLRCVGLGDDPPLIRFLNVKLISLLLCKSNGIIFRLEAHTRALHKVRR